MNKIFFLLLFVVGLSAQTVGGVAVVVKGSAITLLDIKKEMDNQNLDADRAVNLLVRKKLEQIEIKERGLSVSSDDVYDEIKKTASRNNLSVSEFYKAVRDSNGLSSTDLKEQVKYRLLSQKLHAAIAYSHISPPTDSELQEYFELHKDSFERPSAFSVIIYQSSNKARLQEKINNPMFYAPDIQTNEQLLPYDRINPKLASLLTKTEVSTFTPIIPDGKGGAMSFYIKEIQNSEETKIDSVKTEISNIIMDNKREQVLSDYFARLRHSADIKIIRKPE
ncbi:MAG: peptidylprolyl isomerase [Campylobacterota bacterium]|nr:peptidylprolyl isomerase [Campylobacterota bacterium]